jgi:hypothetical protein
MQKDLNLYFLLFLCESNMRIEILTDRHGTEESVQQNIADLKELAEEIPPHRTIVLHEAITSDQQGYTDVFSAGGMSPDDLLEKLTLEENWGPSPYKPLFDYLQLNEYVLRPLDWTLAERRGLASNFGRFVRALDGNPKITSLQLEALFDRITEKLSPEREYSFNQKINKASRESELTVPIMHPDHTQRCFLYLANTRMYGNVHIRQVQKEFKYRVEEIDDEIARKEAKVQLDFAERYDVINQSLPAFVPIVTMAYLELSRAPLPSIKRGII